MTRRSKKTEPSILRFNLALFTLSLATPSATSHIDLSQIASILNRRFYRQGINWAVQSIEHQAQSDDGQPVGNGLVSVYKLPDTWVMSNAWEKAFRTWQRMNNEALEETESVRPRFLDFKIFANDTHHAAGAAANLLPYSATGAGATAGEWKYSKITIPDNEPGGVSDPGGCTDFDMIATGANYPGVSPTTGLDAVSLIEGYAASRGLPPVTDPNVPDDADDVGPDTSNPQNWLSSVFTEGTEQTEDVLDRMMGENNLAPYPFEGATVGGAVITDTMYPNGANQLNGLHAHDIQYITGTSIGGRTNLQGGMFPAGLMEIQTTVAFPAQSAQNVFQGLWITLVPGDHRGYLCEPMTEM